MSLLKAKTAEQVQALIDDGADVSEVGKNGAVILQAKSFKVCKLLLDAGADPNVEHGGKTPLSIAIKKNNAKWVKYLVEKGAKMIDSDWQCVNMDLFMELFNSGYQMDASLFPVLVELDQVDMVKHLMKFRLVPEDGLDEQAKSHAMRWQLQRRPAGPCSGDVIVQAVEADQLGILGNILQRLHQAVVDVFMECKSVECLDLLMDHGMVMTDMFCNWAILNSKIDLLERFCTRANIDFGPNSYENISRYLKGLTDSGMIKLLIRHGVQLTVLYGDKRPVVQTEEIYQLFCNNGVRAKISMDKVTQTQTVDAFFQTNTAAVSRKKYIREMIEADNCNLVAHILRTYRGPFYGDWYQYVQSSTMTRILIPMWNCPMIDQLVEHGVANYFLEGLPKDELVREMFLAQKTESIQVIINHGIPIDSVYQTCVGDTLQRAQYLTMFNNNWCDGDTVLLGYMRNDDRRFSTVQYEFNYVKWLVDHGIPVNAVGSDGKTALDFVKDPGVAALLMKHGALRTTKGNGQLQDLTGMMSQSEYVMLLCRFRAWWIARSGKDLLGAGRTILNGPNLEVWEMIHLLAKMPGQPYRHVLEFV